MFTLTHTTSILVGFTCKNVLYTRSYDFYTHGCDAFTCKNVLNTRSYDFYTHGCDVFTCKNVLNTRLYNLYTCGYDVFTCKNILYTRSYNLCTCGCNVFTSKNILHTLWYALIPIVGTNFYRDNQSFMHANQAMVTNNLTVIIEVEPINVVLIKGFLYLLLD